MKIIEANSWNSLREEIDKILSEREKLSSEKKLNPSQILYRGQSNAEWNLTTTLERKVSGDYGMSRYYRHVFATSHQIEALTSREWNLIPPNEYFSNLKKIEDLWFHDFPGYGYMAYLRHHGFPSPLLDWTKSPYIASFFAFSNVTPGTEKVAIFCYMEYGTSGKVHSEGEPQIISRGPFVRTHKRHFGQQCQYTICAVKKGDDYFYTNHESVFLNNNQRQDYLWKIEAPADIAIEVLKELDSMNINPYTLFDSEDALVETIAFREFSRIDA